MPPLLKCELEGQEFSVTDIVVPLRRGEFLEKSGWIPLLLRQHLMHKVLECGGGLDQSICVRY